MKRCRLRNFIIALVICGLLFGLKQCYGRHPIVELRHRLLRGSELYYSQLAEACAYVWRHYRPQEGSRYLRRSDIEELPPVIEDLGPMSIIVYPEGVQLGWSGFVDYSLVWHRASSNEWALCYVNEEKRQHKTLYKHETQVGPIIEAGSDSDTDTEKRRER